MTALAEGADPFDVRRAWDAPGILRDFNDAGVLTAADVHVARRLAALLGEVDEAVLLGAALAVRAPRLGHVCVDLATAPVTVTTDAEQPADLLALPWPQVSAWTGRLAQSPLVAAGPAGAPDRPLRLVGTRLYLDRYWREERQVAADLLARARQPPMAVDAGALSAGLQRLFDGEPSDLQRLAAATAVRNRFAVVAGGPGTGKTTTVARILSLLDEQAEATGAPPPRVALTAPTGKAAARLEEAVHRAAAGLDIGEQTRARLLALGASTLHRLLGWRRGSRSRFRHDRANRLAHDVVIVDETSMVSLSLMAKLLEAVRAGARLILVGDPEQLASVEAGAVLGDVVGSGTVLGDSIVVLRRVHRYGSGIAALAEAVQRGDADAVIGLLREGRSDVRWFDAGAGADAGADAGAEQAAPALAAVRQAVVEAGRRVTEAARKGDGRAALDALAAMRVLCAHRRGPYGVERWSSDIEGWLAAAIEGYGAGGVWYVGRPLLVTQNDYGLRLYNGDAGVVVATGEGGVSAVFERRGAPLEVSTARLGAVDTVHAMTVHKSQGSQFDAVAVVLPEATSPILTRELLYTAVTRAQQGLTLIGGEASLRAAVARPITRASGLRDALGAVPQGGSF